MIVVLYRIRWFSIVCCYGLDIDLNDQQHKQCNAAGIVFKDPVQGMFDLMIVPHLYPNMLLQTWSSWHTESSSITYFGVSCSSSLYKLCTGVRYSRPWDYFLESEYCMEFMCSQRNSTVLVLCTCH